MKQTVKILAIGQRKQGVSKKYGTPFDKIEISIQYPGKFGFVGDVGEIVAIDAAVVGNRQLNVGDVLEVEMWTQNFRTCVGAIYG